MNIFVTDHDPVVSAQNLCDRHVPKMVLESAQMLSNAFHFSEMGHEAPFRALVVNHPCSKWVLRSKENYLWLLEHSIEISDEYSKRFKKTHACLKALRKCEDNLHKFKFNDNGLTEYVQVMPKIYRNSDVIIAYRSYIKSGKLFAKWDKGTVKPSWFDSHKVVLNQEAVTEYLRRGIEVPFLDS